MLSIERKNEVKEMQKEMHETLKEAVAEVYEEFERTGETFPYLIDGKVVWITYQQLQALKTQSPSQQKEFLENLKQE
jgi:protein involved in temperature-dependent protein secretion